jgi:hypothetical protein
VGIADAARCSQLPLLLGCAAVFIGSPVSNLHAQRVEFRSRSGLYLPTRISLKHGSLNVEQKVGLRFGAGLTVAFNDRFDVVTGVTYIPGYAMFRGAGKDIQVRTGSHLLSGTTAARYWLVPSDRMLSWEVHTGLGVGFGGQAAYQDLFESSTVSGIVGTMVRYQIGRIVRLQLRVQNRLFRANFGRGNPPSTRSPLQVNFGLAFPFLESLRAVSGEI